MRRGIALALAALALSGCVSQKMNSGLAGLVGQDIHVAVAKLGYPDGERKVLGQTVYIWGSSRNTVMPLSTTSTTTGMVGTIPVYGTTTSTEFVPVNFNCLIELATDSHGIVTSYQWRGNMGGCAPYANALAH